MRLSLNEAKIVVSYMHPERVPAGETFITEGDAVNTGFMVLLIDGDVLGVCAAEMPKRVIAS